MEEREAVTFSSFGGLSIVTRSMVPLAAPCRRASTCSQHAPLHTVTQRAGSSWSLCPEVGGLIGRLIGRPLTRRRGELAAVPEAHRLQNTSCFSCVAKKIKKKNDNDNSNNTNDPIRGAAPPPRPSSPLSSQRHRSEFSTNQNAAIGADSLFWTRWT